MPTERSTEPGLVVLYDIWPENGAGLFLQPRSPRAAGPVKGAPPNDDDDNGHRSHSLRKQVKKCFLRHFR